MSMTLPPTITTSYGPLHPGNEVAVTFRVQAEDPVGITRVELYLYEYALTEDEDGMQVGKVRKGGQWGLVEEWSFSPPETTVSEAYTHSPGFPPESYVRYLFRVTNAGRSRRSEEWLFAAGDWPFPDTPVPILTNGPPGKRVNLTFVADETYPDAAAMLGDLEGLIFDGYQRNNAIRGDRRRYWQFYYSLEKGLIDDGISTDGSRIIQTKKILDVPVSVKDARISTYAAVVHKDDSITNWAVGSMFGAHAERPGVAVHEGGHAVFGLADEYPGGMHWLSTAPHHNNFDSPAAENDAGENDLSDESLESIEPGWWKPSELQCIMDGDLQEMREFERSCIERVNWYYGQLEPLGSRRLMKVLEERLESTKP